MEGNLHWPNNLTVVGIELLKKGDMLGNNSNFAVGLQVKWPFNIY